MVRAKFICNVIEPAKYSGEDAFNIVLNVSTVYNDKDPKQEKFWKYTPSGSITLSCLNEKASKQFEKGKMYYVDFTEVDEQ